MTTQHRRSIRLTTYNYAQPGAYFVTICTHNRACTLANPCIRRFVEDSWKVAGQSTAPGDFVIMPNHVHGIVLIGDPDPGRGLAIPRTAKPRMFATGIEPSSLGAIVGMFKALSTKKIRNMSDAPNGPVWQRNYYERVLRDGRELDAARQYILDNPGKWSEDKHNPVAHRVK